jgi:hypothetical protein
VQIGGVFSFEVLEFVKGSSSVNKVAIGLRLDIGGNIRGEDRIGRKLAYKADNLGRLD